MSATLPEHDTLQPPLLSIGHADSLISTNLHRGGGYVALQASLQLYDLLFSLAEHVLKLLDESLLQGQGGLVCLPHDLQSSFSTMFGLCHTGLGSTQLVLGLLREKRDSLHHTHVNYVTANFMSPSLEVL